jgi:hypothetical protein
MASNRSVSAGAGPRSRTTSARADAVTYAVASHGTAASRSAATTGTVNAPSTRRAAATSVRNRGSAAASASTTRTTTRSPFGAAPRNTLDSSRSSPDSPSCSTSWYGPTVVSGTTTLNPHSQWQKQLFPHNSHPKQGSKAPIPQKRPVPAVTCPAVTCNDFGTVCAYGCLVPVAYVTKCAES